jgi:NADPH:quinone reductase-like Zn-dependent oxidoreductase
MKAACRSKYGKADVLSIKELNKPTPKNHEVLVKVHAATVNRSDCHVLTGKPFIMRFFTGLFRPKLLITGSDFVGEIETVGTHVTHFKPGDKVMGFIDMGVQSHAQYLTVAETKIVRAPSNATYQQAVACLEGAFYAICVIHAIKPKAGQKALVIGATGAIGSSYVQFFKGHGVHVTGVCGGENSDLVRSLGANSIIDFKTEDFTKTEERFEIIIDAVGKSSFSQCKHLLRDKGIFTSSEPNLFEAVTTPIFGGKKVVFIIPKNLIENLNIIKDHVERGSFIGVIDRKYPLDEIEDAYNYVASGQKIGNVIIVMNS